MKKIILDKSEDIAEAIDRILSEPDTGVVLVVPRGSALGKSVRNFHLLKREMESAGRQLEVESVDEEILALAKQAKIPGRHPLLTRANGGAVSDIVAMTGRVSETTIELEDDTKAKKKNGKGKRDEDADAVRIEVREESAVALPVDDDSADDDDHNGAGDETPAHAYARAESGSSGFFGKDRFFRENPAAYADDDDDSPRRGPWKGIGITLGIIIVAAIAFFVVTNVASHATVVIDFVKTPWQDTATFTADKSLASPNPANNTVPAQVFFENKDVTQLFPASGSSNVSLKSQGTLTIYNAYSSAPQTLVATTRFATPDGKIFRLVNQVVVPGATITNGNIVPSSINAAIAADQPGPSYNIGAVPKLTVPGFAGTPKFNGFYGTIASGTTGGFSGVKAVPTAADIAAAKASTTALLQNALQSAANFDIPANFKILPGATNVQITKLTVNTSTDQNGNFSVFGQVTYQAIGFDESQLTVALLADAQTTEPSSTFSAIALTYATATPDFTDGRLSFSVSAQGSLEPAFSPDSWKQGIAGVRIQDAQAAIAALPQLQDGKISVWPVWLWSIPSNPAKISVTVN